MGPVRYLRRQITASCSRIKGSGLDSEIPVKLLGQSGCRLQLGKSVIYIDPYLSNSVQELDSADLVRLTPILIDPDNIRDANWVLITHDHIDHCDPHTLPRIAAASPNCMFIGPSTVLANLATWGVPVERLLALEKGWMRLADGLQLHHVPAAHPEIDIDQRGLPKCVGYVIEYQEKRMYFAGDTGLCDELVDALIRLSPLDTAFLPVNEQNYFRRKHGIIGNMSVREAFGLAQVLGIKQVVPVHWDMFISNSVFKEEIEVIHEKMDMGFRLLMNPDILEL